MQLSLYDSGGIVHWSPLKTSERKHYSVVRLATTKGFILCASSAFVAYKVRISAAKSRGTSRFMSINHDVTLGSFFNNVKVMVVHFL